MSVGLAAFGVSKPMLCATDPNVKVTISPALIVSVLGENNKVGVALTVFAGGGGFCVPPPVFPPPPLVLTPVGPPEPPQAANATMTEALIVRVMLDMELVLSVLCKGLHEHRNNSLSEPGSIE